MTKKQDTPKAAPRPHLTPQALFRFVALNPEYQANLENSYTSGRNLPTREELSAFESIRKAETPLQVVAMTRYARGIAHLAWMARLNQFGPEAIPAIQRGLRVSQSKMDAQEIHRAVEQLIAALWRLGPVGGEVLLDCFNSLDDYCQSVACVAFGALRTQQALDTVWRYYQRVKSSTEEGLMIGALMALVYLRHPQIDETLAEVLSTAHNYVEPYPFTALAGGRACVRPLAFRLGASLDQPDHYEGEQEDLVMTMAAIAHHIGLEEYRAALTEVIELPATVNVLVDAAVNRPPEEVQRYFKLFYDDPQPVLPEIKVVTEEVTPTDATSQSV